MVEILITLIWKNNIKMNVFKSNIHTIYVLYFVRDFTLDSITIFEIFNFDKNKNFRIKHFKFLMWYFHMLVKSITRKMNTWCMCIIYNDLFIILLWGKCFSTYLYIILWFYIEYKNKSYAYIYVIIFKVRKDLILDKTNKQKSFSQKEHYIHTYAYCILYALHTYIMNLSKYKE